MLGLGNSALLPMRDLFTAQFTRDSEGIIYREDAKGRAIRITRAEAVRFRAEFEQAFAGHLWRLLAGLAAAALLWVAWIAHAGVAADSALVAVLGLGVVLAPVYIWMIIASNTARKAPSRRLERRPSAAPPLSPQEAKLQRARRTSWSQFAAALIALVMIYYSRGPRSDFFSGDNVWWTIGAIVLLIGLGHSGWSK